jgi:hypothetical protein
MAMTRMLSASLLFSASISMRSIDLTICDDWPYGTHIFWHLLNAAVLYLVVRAYILISDLIKRTPPREG